MLVTVRRLVEHEAVGRTADVGAGFFAVGEGLMVGLEVVAEQRQTKSSLPLERAVAGAAVAAKAT